MSLFIILFILIALFAVMDYYSQHNIGLFLSAIVLAVVAGIRYNVGYDYQSYYVYYQSGQNIGDGDRFQWGFILLNKIAHFFHFSFFDFQFLFACLTIGLLAVFLYKNIPAGISGLGMLYYFSRFFWTRDLGQIRSSLASVICLYSLKYITERKPIPFLIVILLAGSIHKGAYIFIFAYIFANYIDHSVSMIEVSVILGLSFMIGTVLQNMPSLVEQVTGGGVYITSSYYVQDSTASISTLIMQILIILAYMLMRKYRGASPFMDTMANVYIMGTVIALLFIGYKTFGYRLDTILNTTEVIIVTYIIQRTVKSKVIELCLTIIVSAIVLYLIIFTSKAYINFIPFNTIFSPIK